MTDDIQAAAERINRVKAGEEKLAVYPHPDPNAHEMTKLGHAEFSHYYDVEALADAYLALGERQPDEFHVSSLETFAMGCRDEQKVREVAEKLRANGGHDVTITQHAHFRKTISPVEEGTAT
jgi:hypothetical protein